MPSADSSDSSHGNMDVRKWVRSVEGTAMSVDSGGRRVSFLVQDTNLFSEQDLPSKAA
jgi:hypothetical protein